MGSTPVAEADPLERRLRRVLDYLVEEGDARSIVRLVERWAEQRTLPMEALRAQARALISLRLMDRAWVRLQEARELTPADTETQMLTATMFVERGWPARARRILERIEVPDVALPELDTLREAAARSPMQPPANAQEIERTGDADAVLDLAERYMAAGSFVRAQGLLERLHRQGLGGRRVADLLWAIAGEYSSGKLPLEALLDELSPEARLSEWEGIELTESLQAREETAHDPAAAERELLAASDDRESGRPAFPDLFRRGESTVDETTMLDEDEVTVASSMATLDQMVDVPSDQHTDPGVSETGEGGDTRIMEVIGGEVQDLDPAQPIHRSPGPMASAGAELGSTLDLRSYRDSMGVEGLSLDAETFLEEEDQDLIVMTRREGRDRSAATAPTRPLSQTVETGVRGTHKPSVRPPEEPEDPEDTESTETLPSGAPLKRRRWLQLARGVGAVASGMILVGWLILFGLHQVAGRQVIEDTHTVVASGHFRAIQELEAKLESQVRAEREPYDVRVLELALVRVVLWSEYTGDSDRLAQATEALRGMAARGESAQDIPLIQGMLSLTRGDLVSAQALASQVDTEDPLGRTLVARVAVARGERAALEAAWTRVGGEGQMDGPLVQVLALEALATALGEDDVAGMARERMLSLEADNALVQLARFEGGWGQQQGPQQRLIQLTQVKEYLPSAISPRQAGRFHALRAQFMAQFGEEGLARDAWKRALAEDRTHPVYLYRAAAEAVRENRLIAAEDDLRRCLEARPWDRDCRRGMVQVLIDLDRVKTARERVRAWDTPGVDVATLDAWITLADGAPQDALDKLGARGREGGVAAYVESMARAALEAPGADEALVAVVTAMAASGDLLDRVLAGRAEAARMPLVGRAGISEVEKRAVALAPFDPMIQVLFGRFYESKGRRQDAQEAFDLGARIGVESARAHNAKGLFYFDPRGDMAQAMSAFRRYLALQPDGAQAERARERTRPR